MMTKKELNASANSDVLTAIKENSQSLKQGQLIVYNDDFNTFDWVIQCFMEVCDHSFVQSEQLSLIVHYKGKAIVKTGKMEKLKPMKDALIERGLSAVIDNMVES